MTRPDEESDANTGHTVRRGRDWLSRQLACSLPPMPTREGTWIHWASVPRALGGPRLASTCQYVALGLPLPQVAFPLVDSASDPIHFICRISVPRTWPQRALRAALSSPRLFVCGSSIGINSAMLHQSPKCTPYPPTIPAEGWRSEDPSR